MKRIGIMVRKLREGQGLTQTELAKRAHVTQAYVAMLEARVKTNPSIQVLQRLAKALKVRVEELIK
jgi:XRE family transcriptional regulator, master regulator for biofilm formation